MKKGILLLVLTMLLLSGCGSPAQELAGGAKSEEILATVSSELGTDTCQNFTADFVYSATGKPIVRFDNGPMSAPSYCQYYTDYAEDFYKLPEGKTAPGGNWVSIKFNNLSVQNQKDGQAVLGRTISTDPRIKMEHFLAIQENGKINDIYLVLGPNSFLSINRSSGAVLSEDEIVLFAAKVAEKIQGSLSFELKTNPTETKPDTIAPPPTTESQETFARSFFDNLATGKFSEALALMDANTQTKAMWETNFKTIQSVQIEKVEPAFPEEWTATRQTYKFTLQVTVTPEGEQYGWSNGKNLRWLTIEKTGENWQVHELANNP